MMDENATAALSVICRDYRASFVPPSLGNDWADTERANRGFVAIGLAGQNAMFKGASRILEHVDALCRVASVRKVLLLAENPLLEDLAPRTLGMVCPDGEAELLPHLRWLLAAIRGRAGDISSLWTEQTPEDAHASLVRLYKDSLASYALVREATGKRPKVVPSSESTEAAQRLGIVSWTESAFAPDGGHRALREVLDDYPDELAYEALAWHAQITCRTPHEPRCLCCSVAVDCRALAEGWF